MKRRPIVIGLTGNVATGKSQVAAMLKEMGARVIDADQVAHAAMRRGGPVYDRVVEAFGAGVVASDGEIDRARLGAIVFRQPEALQRLEAIVHPAVKAEVEQRVAEATEPAVVVEAIKLIEAGMQRHCDELWVVTAPRDQQIARLTTRRALGEAEAALRVDAQSPQEDKAALADRLIVNDGDLKGLRRQVEAAWSSARRRAARQALQAGVSLGVSRVGGAIPMSIRAWIGRHPQLTAWAALAVGMVVILIVAARNVGLLPHQWAALIVATILLAGLCVWIIGWDAEEEPEATEDTENKTSAGK